MSVVERATAHAVCRLGHLDPERGAAALVADRQVALFRLPDDQVVAVDHRDPATGANVVARGLLGTTAEGEWYVASPLLKHRYSLTDGRCLGEPSLSIAVHGVEVRDGVVHVILASSS